MAKNPSARGMEDAGNLGSEPHADFNAHDVTAADHIADTDNPHQVTAEQVGALTEETDPVAGAALALHVADTNNPHGVTAGQVGLGDVDNTSDAQKPVSIATQEAINAVMASILNGGTYRVGLNELGGATPVLGQVLFFETTSGALGTTVLTAPSGHGVVFACGIVTGVATQPSEYWEITVFYVNSIGNITRIPISLLTGTTIYTYCPCNPSDAAVPGVYRLLANNFEASGRANFTILIGSDDEYAYLMSVPTFSDPS